MKKKQYLNFVIWISVIFVPINVNAKNIHSRHRRRVSDGEDYETNRIYEVNEPSASSHSSQDANLPTPKESMTTFMTYERKSPSKNYQKRILSSNYKQQSPISTSSVKRRHSGKESANDEHGYILTAGGKENVYEEDTTNNGHRPHEFEVSYPEKQYDPETYSSGSKRVSNTQKSYNRYQYSYSNQEPVDGHPKGASGSRNDILKSRAFHPESQRHPEDFGNRPQSWKQLGPNVEISASAENQQQVYVKQSEPKDKSRKMYKKRKNSPNKGTKTGYMAQSHALYVANNLQNLKPLKGAFDHNTVLRHSDKFEISDAMVSEIDKEVTKKLNEHKIRVKQESPKDQRPYNFEPHHQQNFQYYNPYVPQQQFFNAPANQFQQKFNYPYLGGAFSKGFIRNIEVEANAAGQRKTVPALIIPLTPEQVQNQYLGGDMMSSAYVNNAEVVSPKPKAPVPFPYDFVNARPFAQADANAILPGDNYQFQNFNTHQFKSVQNPEDAYSMFLNYPNTALFSRYSTPTPATDDGNKEPVDDEYSSQSYYQNNNSEQQSNLPYTVIIPGKSSTPATQVNTVRSDFKASPYYEEPNDESKYLSASESNYHSTVASTKENKNSSLTSEKSETRRN